MTSKRKNPETENDMVTRKQTHLETSSQLYFGVRDLKWRKITASNLDLDYTLLFTNDEATQLFNTLEDSLEYFTGQLSKVKVFGKWHDIPRKQVTFGDEGLTYKYSGIITPARPWPPALFAVKELLKKVTSHGYNFVLVNRYKDGSDKMGEHKDDEKELDPNIPIASVSLGQEREFYFRHQDRRNKDKKQENKKGRLLVVVLVASVMKKYWYIV